MVIATSDSNETLVSLHNNGLKRSGSLEFLRASPRTQSFEFFPTDLFLPADNGEFFGDADDDESFYSCSGDDEAAISINNNHNTTYSRDCLYLPESNALSLDECVKCIPTMMETCDALLSQTPRHYTERSRTRVLYAAQREVAHAVPLQCDVIMSDKATTCHILALYSSSCAVGGGAAVPLASLAHIDGTGYEACIRAMVKRHLHHHQMDDSLIQEREKEGEEKKDNVESSMLELQVHIMGGFEDRDGTSRKISNWLLRVLADIAREEKRRMVTTLCTCAISSVNDNGHGAPIGRGLAIGLCTGDVFLASCDQAVAGPDCILRSLRLWGNDYGERRLEVVHDERLNMLKVTPFYFAPFPELNSLLKLSDRRLLKHTSTSPECEEDDFCPRLRQALVFLRDVPPERIFGHELNRTRHFKRIGHSNVWKGLHV